MDENKSFEEVKEEVIEIKEELEERDATLDDERDATLDRDMPEGLSEDEVQERILEDSNMNGFQKTIARMDDKKWTLAQRIGGIILGLGTSLALFWEAISGKQGDTQKNFSYTLIIAVVLAILVPNIIEKQGARKIPKLRIAMVITLLVCIAVYTVYMLATGGFRGAA